MPCRLLALDIDGTLLGADRRVSARTRDAVAAARALGVRVVLVTGRRYPSAFGVARDVGPDLPLVLHNGALIVDAGEVVACTPLPLDVARAAVRVGRACGADAVVHRGRNGEGRLVIEGVSASNTLLAYYLDRSHPDVSHVADLLEALDDDTLEVMFGGSRASMDAVLPALSEALGERARLERTVYPARDVSLIDVVHPRVGKADALDFLCGRWDVPIEQSMAIGDNWNDREMLERAGLGLVMGNADPELRALGFEVLPPNDQDGVATAIERHILGAPAIAHNI